MVIRQIKSGTGAVGPDNGPPEALKSYMEVTANIQQVPFRKIWEEEQVQTDWIKGHLIRLPKKGDLRNREN